MKWYLFAVTTLLVAQSWGMAQGLLGQQDERVMNGSYEVLRSFSMSVEGQVVSFTAG